MATQTAPQTAHFDWSLLPNAILGFFGIRTEDEMPFETRLRAGRFSVRHYPAHSEIRNEEVGTREEAADRSFDRLLNYIEGGNWDARKFAMTSPVLQRPQGRSRWTTSFFLKGAVENLPIPKSSAVRLYAMNSETDAVLRFSGRPTEERVRAQIVRLLGWMNEKGLRAVGEPFVAVYDQPFSIPFLRRNEIRIPIES